MRRYLLSFLTILAVLAVMIFGIIKKQTYTDLTKQEDYLTQLYVAELSERLTEDQCADMKQRLPGAAIIIRVEVTGEIEHLFKVDRQKAVIREIYAGSGLEQDEEIYIFSDGWSLALGGNLHSLERGFVNIMDVGTEYLIFAEAVVESPLTDVLSVKTYDDFFVVPIFCYEDHQNKIIPVTGIPTYVPYQEVMGNEFFAATERALQMFEELKAQMLQLYPRGEGA